MMKLRLIASGATIVALLAVFAVAAGQDAAEEEHDYSQMQPVSEEPVKLVHVLNPGEREYLSPNLIGVQNIAMTFLPLSINFVNIIDAFREIVDGVRYEIILNAVDGKVNGNDAELVCRLVILEKPWIRTEWGDKLRELQHSNCTRDEDNLTDPVGRSKVLNDKYQRNAIFNAGSRNALSDDEMAKLESQIMEYPSDTKRQVTTPTDTIITTTSASATESQTQINEDATIATPTSSDNADDSDASTLPPKFTEDEVKWLDEYLSVGAVNFESTLRDAKNQKEDDGQSNNLQHTAHTEQFQANEETTQQQTQNQNSNEEQRLQQQQQQEPESEQFEDIHIRAKRDENGLVGAPNQIEIVEAEKRLQESLKQLASGDGPVYTIGKVYSATSQLVSGTITKLDADLVNPENVTERCDVEIWSQPWLNKGTEVTFKCPQKEVVKRRHSRSVEYAEKKTHKKRNHHNLDKTEHLFHKFQTKYKRIYHNSMERQMRLRIFKQNLKTIEELNHNEMGSAKYGLTEFADMTSGEYKQRTGLWQREADKPSKNAAAIIPEVELPKEFDWREKGAISKVKNQGSCGSCWAFSVTGNIEGLHAVKTGKLDEYSEQELIDCDTIDSGCNGGLPDNAYEAIEKIGGLELETEYPYHGRKEQCNFNKSMSHVQLNGAIDFPKNETAMAQWLLVNGPISIGINANAMQFYRGGVSHPWHPLCSRKNLDHGVLIVGFGVSDYPMLKKTLPYWIVKNSWGPKWGEQGYYRVYRGDNTCGISEMATSAVLADN